MFTYRPSEYRLYLQQSKKHHLLVEGSTDKRLFGRLLEELYGKDHGIMVDSAEQLIECSASNAGNAGAVEDMCASVSGKPYADLLVGFVDREYRDFDTNEALRDQISKHKVVGRLVWSRGHSIENYYFDFSMLEEPLRTFSVTEYFDEALRLFKGIFEATIRLACAVSLVEADALHLGLIKKLDIVRDSVLSDNNKRKSALMIDEDISLDFITVQENLVQKYNLSLEVATKVTTKLQSYLGRVESADFDVVRWLCRGHTGFRFVWRVYGYCVFTVCSRKQGVDPNKEASHALSADEALRFNICAESWVRKSLGNQNAYPLEVLRLLGLPELS